MTEGHVAANALGWFGLGLSAGPMLALLARHWSPRRLLPDSPRRRRGAIAAPAGIAILATALLVAPHREQVANTHTASGNAAVAPAMSGSSAAAKGGSMEEETAALSARLAAKGGTDGDWELLAQSYDFLGRGAEAQQARQHQVSPQRSLRDSVLASAQLLDAGTARPAAPQGTATPSGKAAALLVQAEEHRRKREFQQACDRYRAAIAAGGMTADAWADYADALASATSAGSLRGEPAKAIDRALALDPNHAKALWLKASLAHEEGRYPDALKAWRQLLALVPSGSSDARIIEANIAEATRLAGAKG